MLPHLFPKSASKQLQFNNECSWQFNSSNAVDLLFNTKNQKKSIQNVFSTTNQLPTTTLTDNNLFFTQNSNNKKVIFTKPIEFIVTENNNNCMAETILAQQNLQSQAITITLQYGSQKEIIVVERTQDPQVLKTVFRFKNCL